MGAWRLGPLAREAPMTTELAFDIRLARAVSDRLATLQSEFPDTSLEPLRHLPDLYRLLWRLAFDMEIEPAVRHYAASLAFYVFSRIDYISEETETPAGYLDDLAVAARGARRILQRLGPEKIAPHWRSEEPLGALIERADTLASSLLPGRVEERVTAYIEH